jgi:3-hydroxybutyryl-CoA dehydratase
MTEFPATIAPMTLTTSGAAAEAYAALTKDFNPIHLDPNFAKGTAFGHPIAHGTMALNLLYAAVDDATAQAFYIADLDIRFSAPTYVGQVITGVLRQQNGALYALEVRTDDNRVVLTGTARLANRAAP